MASGPSITATIGVDTKPLQAGLNNARQGVGRFGQEVGNAGKGAGMLTGLLGGLGIASVISFGKSLFNLAGDLTDTAENLDMNAESLQRWQSAFANGGVEAGKLEAALGKFNVKIAEAREGSDSAREALARLGITTADLQNLSMDQMLLKASDAAKSYTDSTRLAADMQAVFGKGGQRMIGVLKQGSEELSKQRDEAVALSDTHRKILDDMGDNTASFWRSTKAAAATGMAELLSIMTTGKMTQQGQDAMLGLPTTKPASEKKSVIGPYIAPTKEETDNQAKVADTIQKDADAALNAKVRALDAERDAAFSLLDPLRKIEDIRIRMARNAVQSVGVDGKRRADLLAENVLLKEQARALFIQAEAAGPAGRLAASRASRKALKASDKFDRMQEHDLKEAERLARTGARRGKVRGMPDRGKVVDKVEVQLAENGGILKEIREALKGKFTNE